MGGALGGHVWGGAGGVGESWLVKPLEVGTVLVLNEAEDRSRVHLVYCVEHVEHAAWVAWIRCC